MFHKIVNITCERSHSYDESEWSLMTSLIRRLGFSQVPSAGRSFNEIRGSYVKIQAQPRFVIAAFVGGTQTKGFPRDGKCTMLIHCPASLRARRFEKSTDVGPIVRNGSMFPQWCGARWRRQDTVHKSIVNSTEVVFAAVPPCGTIEISCNQVNLLRNHDGTKSENELLGDAFLPGVDVADM